MGEDALVRPARFERAERYVGRLDDVCSSPLS